MTYKEILLRFKKYLTKPTKIPKCFSDENFLYCFCGKCEPKNHPLPEDFSRLVAISAAEHYTKIKLLDSTK